MQEGVAIVSLHSKVYFQDESGRSMTTAELSFSAKAYYDEQKLIRLENIDGSMEVPVQNIASIFWREKTRRYRLKPAGS